MNDVLIRIKRAVLSGRYFFSEKARSEMESDGLSELDIAESILNFPFPSVIIHCKSVLRKILYTDPILVFCGTETPYVPEHALFRQAGGFFRSETDDFSFSDRQAKIMPKKTKIGSVYIKSEFL